MKGAGLPQSSSLPALAFLGIRLMGKSMATRLLQAGYALVLDMSSTPQSEAVGTTCKAGSKRYRICRCPRFRRRDRRPRFQARRTSIVSDWGRPTLVGRGQIAKLCNLCNQLIVGGTLSIIAEALRLAQVVGRRSQGNRASKFL